MYYIIYSMKQNILVANPSFLISSSLFCLYLHHNNVHAYFTIDHHPYHHRIHHQIIESATIIEFITIVYHDHVFHIHITNIIAALLTIYYYYKWIDCIYIILFIGIKSMRSTTATMIYYYYILLQMNPIQHLCKSETGPIMIIICIVSASTTIAEFMIIFFSSFH